jgi:hypothetical protein
MTGLKTSSKYYYRVGDRFIKRMSDLKYFHTAPEPGSVEPLINIAFFGDEGTIIPFAGPVSKMIARDN